MGGDRGGGGANGTSDLTARFTQYAFGLIERASPPYGSRIISRFGAETPLVTATA